MDRRQSAEYAFRIAATRDDITDFQRYLATANQQMLLAERTIEDLAIDACTLRVRMKELELDEELVKKSEEEAIMEKIIAQKRLVEIGGHESAIRALQKALHDAKQELLATKEETLNVISEEKKMQAELINLGAILQRSRSNSVKLQEDYSVVVKEKRESDAKLKQLCMFLQTDAPASPQSVASDASTLSPSASSSPTAAPSSPRVVLHLGDGVQVAVPEVHF